jgi:hypothetical protein
MDRKKMHEQLLKRTEESYSRKDGEVSYKYFISDNELPLWKPSVTKTDPHIVDIIPFEAGENYPLIKGRKSVRKGDIVYLVDIEVHQNVGPLKEMVICPAKNYGKPCPICEEIGRMRQEGAEWEEYRDIDTKRRCCYNVLVTSTEKDKEKGVQIWEVSHRFSEKQILSIAKSPRGGGYVAFSHPDKSIGKSIAFEVDEDTYRTVHGHKFVDRDYDISDEILTKAYPLDDLLIVHPYEKLKELFFGSQEEKPTESKKEEHKPAPEAAVNAPASPETATSRRKRFAEKTENPCPYGHKFGVDIDNKEECKKCDMDTYTKCAELADKLELEAKNK